MTEPRKRSIVAAAGATPCAQRTSGSPRGRPENGGQVAAGAVQVRLDHLEHEAGGDGGVECVAAPLEHDIPVEDASQCVDATTPKVPRSSGRVG